MNSEVEKVLITAQPRDSSRSSQYLSLRRTDGSFT